MDSDEEKEDEKKYLRGWEAVENLELSKVLEAYKDLLIKYNRIIIAKEEKYKRLRRGGGMCCSCDTHFGRHRDYEDAKCHGCGLYPCNDCIVECPNDRRGCCLCKSCAPDIKECPNCHQAHCSWDYIHKICSSCSACKCAVCGLVKLQTRLSEYGECEACRIIREKTCGAKANVYKHRQPSYGYRDRQLPQGCGKIVDKINYDGICADCDKRIDHTCKECAKVVPERLNDGRCNDCHKRWYAANKCSRCKNIKSSLAGINLLGLCNQCFTIFEKCCVCQRSIELATITAPVAFAAAHTRAYIKTHPAPPSPLISSSLGQSKCADCYSSGRK